MSDLSKTLQTISEEKRTYLLRTLPSHIKTLRDLERLKRILTNYSFLQAKLNLFGPHTVLEDYSNVEDEGLSLIHKALQLSMHHLYDDPLQLPSQIVGRLFGYSHYTIVQALVKDTNPSWTWLCPVVSGLTLPDNSLIRTIKVYGRKVIDLLVIPGSDWIVCRFMDLAVKILNILDGSELFTLSNGEEEITLFGTPWPVSALKLSTDGGKVIYSSNNSIRAWDIAKKTHTVEFVGHTDTVTGIDVTPDGRFLISCSWDKTIRIWELNSGIEIKTLHKHVNRVSSVAISEDGTTLVSGSWDGEIEIWDLINHDNITNIHTAEKSTELSRYRTTVSFATGKYQTDLHDGLDLIDFSYGQPARITILKFLDANQSILSASIDTPTVVVWDVKNRKEMFRFVNSNSESVDITMTISDTEELSLMQGHGTSSVAISADKKYAILCAGTAMPTITGQFGRFGYSSDESYTRPSLDEPTESEIRVWNLQDRTKVQNLRGHTNGVIAAYISTDKDEVVSSSWDGTIKIWNNYTTQRDISQVERIHSNIAENLFKESLQNDENTHSLLNLRENTKSVHLNQGEDHLTTIVIEDSDDEVETLKIESNRNINSYILHPNNAKLIAFTTGEGVIEGKPIASDCEITIWNVKNGDLLTTLIGHTSWVNKVLISSDTKYLVSGSDDFTIKLWDLNSGENLYTFYGHRAGISDICILSNNGIVSLSHDFTVRVWSIEKHTQIAIYASDCYLKSLKVTNEDNKVTVSVTDEWEQLHVLDLKNLQEALEHRSRDYSGYVRDIDIQIADRKYTFGDELAERENYEIASIYYKQALMTWEKYDDRRRIAITCHAIADALISQRQWSKALLHYTRALIILEETEDVACTPLEYMLGQIYLSDGLYSIGIQHLWKSYTWSRHFSQIDHLNQVKNLLSTFKANYGHEHFDELWAEHLNDPQPDWLNIPNVNYIGLSSEEKQVVIANTVAVMTYAESQSSAWQADVEHALRLSHIRGDHNLVDFNQAVLQLIKNSTADLPATNPYHADWEIILDDIRHYRTAKHISPEDINAIVKNTISVLKSNLDQLTAWREITEHNLKSVVENNMSNEIEFFTALLYLLQGKKATLAQNSPYLLDLQQIIVSLETEDDDKPLS